MFSSLYKFCQVSQWGFIFFLILSYSSIFALEEHPYYDHRYFARNYESSSFKVNISNASCPSTYQEVSLENKIPLAKDLPHFKFEHFIETPFTHPFIKEFKSFLALSWDSRGESSGGSVKIPLSIEIPRYARSFGIFLGGDGFTQNTLEISLKEKNKVRFFTLKKVFLNKTYSLYIFPLTFNFRSILENIYIRGQRGDGNSSRFFPIKQVFVGPISFYDFKVPSPFQKVQSLEKILTPLSFEEDTSKSSVLSYKNYLLNPEGLWNKDDELFLDFENLQVGFLEIYAYVRNRITHRFLLRFLVSKINPSTQGHTCVQLSLPQELVLSQQKKTGGIYFVLTGVRWLPTQSSFSGQPTLKKAFFQRKNWKLYSYPIDK